MIAFPDTTRCNLTCSSLGHILYILVHAFTELMLPLLNKWNLEVFGTMKIILIFYDKLVEVEKLL